MSTLRPPDVVPNLVANADRPARDGRRFEKRAPADGRLLCGVARSAAADVHEAVSLAAAAQPAWAETTVVRRAELLRELALALRAQRAAIAELVALETGKSKQDALGETDGAIEMGFFVAGEGRRFYGRTTPSAVPNKTAVTVRQPLGVAGLVVAANTPIANVAWKVFPALLCGNAAVLKPAEDTPLSAWAFGVLAREIGLPPSVLQIVHGMGDEAGAPLVESPQVDVVSFTGSCEVGRGIAAKAGERLAKVCLELGGKNAFVVCDDADLDVAARWAALSAFSNAGQRCAAGSRIVVMDAVYERFRALLVARTKALRVGTADGDDLGPVINERQLAGMLEAIEAARKAGAAVLCGGGRLRGPGYDGGFYLAPTLIEGATPGDAVSQRELFGPITCLYRVSGFDEAVALANDSPFGLTAAIHTRSLHRAMTFQARARTGVVSVNGGTYGSEPHLPFGGLRASGNGFREAGTEALDVYSDWKTLYVSFDPAATGGGAA